MTTALFTDYIIHAGETVNGRRYTQFWGNAKIAGMDSLVCYAGIAEDDSGVSVGIESYCPIDLVPEILEAYRVFREGGNVPRTHSVEWVWGKPIFTPIPC